MIDEKILEEISSLKIDWPLAIRTAKKDGETIYGYILTYLKDNYNIAKPDAAPIAIYLIGEYAVNKRLVDELENKPDASKVAVLVDFGIRTRVIVDGDVNGNYDEDKAVEKAIEKIKNNIDDYIIGDNFIETFEDNEFPFDPTNDKIE